MLLVPLFLWIGSAGGAFSQEESGGGEEGSEPQETALEPPPPEAQETPTGEVLLPATEIRDEEVAPALRQEPGARFDGFVNLRTLSRWADDAGDHDHDLYGVVGLNYRSAGTSPWSAHVVLQGAFALDSQPPDSSFYGVLDAQDDSVDLRLYRAWVDLPTSDAVELAQVGRMALYDTPETAYFDGVHARTAPVGVTQVIVGAYVGQSVHLFEGWPSDEWIAGAYTRFRPWVDGQLRLDWMHLDDDLRAGDGQNELVSGSLTHWFAERVRLDGRYTLLDGEGRDLRLKGLWLWPEEDLTVRVRFYRLLNPQENLAFELNPYFNILNTYFPYDQTEVVLAKGFGDVLQLSGGWSSRRVQDEGDIGRFNREFDRYYVTASFPDVLPMETTWSVTGEVWESPDNDVQTWGQDFTTQWSEDVRTSFGSYYSLYKYLFDVSEERDSVRTYYAEVRKRMGDALNLEARYEFEDESLDSFHSIRLGATWRF